MQRELVCTYEIKSNELVFNILENIDGDLILLFQNHAINRKNIDSFLQHSILKAEKKIGGKISEVTFLLEPSKEQLDTNQVGIKMIKQEFKLIPGELISKREIDSSIQSVKDKILKYDNKVATFVQPMLYSITNEGKRKNYNSAPIDKMGESLIMLCSVTIISNKMHKYIHGIASAQNIKVKQILLNSQTITHNNISSHLLTKGSILMNIGYQNTFITVTKNKAVSSLEVIHNFGWKKLIQTVAKHTNATYTEVEEMINLYGNVNSKQKNHIIYTNYDILRDKPFNSNALAKIISEFYKVLLGKVKNFLLKENYKSYGVVLSSFEYKIEGIEEMAKSFLN